MDTAFGAVLREWRNQRRMSQLDLGLSANVSARHISFLETGRSRPSRDMVMHLCEELAVPRSIRNSFLNAAGFRSAYQKRDLDDGEMAPVRAAVDWTLQRHNPFPAMALDRHWRLVKANQTAAMLLSVVGVREGDSLLDVFTNPAIMGPVIENWHEVAHHFMVRLRTESAHLGGDPVLDAAAEKLADQLIAEKSEINVPLPAVLPTRYRVNGTVLSFFSTIAQFGSAEDIALADLKIELGFPADDYTRDILLAAEDNKAPYPS